VCQKASPKYRALSSQILTSLFNETIQLFLEFLPERETFLENKLTISVQFFNSTGFFQFQPAHFYPLKDCDFHIWNLGTLGTHPQSQFVIGFFETFLVDGKFRGLSNKPLHARFGPLL
jgi:hypothetical protein